MRQCSTCRQRRRVSHEKATVTIVAGGYRLCPDAYGHDLVSKPDKSIEIQDRLEIRLL